MRTRLFVLGFVLLFSGLLIFGQTFCEFTESNAASASADQLQQENATVGTVIENRDIAQLPLNGRNYLNLVALAANVNTLSPPSGQAGSRQGGDRANQSISAAGQRIMF